MFQDLKSKISEKSDQNWGCSSSALLGWGAAKIGCARLLQFVFSMEQPQFWSDFPEIFNLRSWNTFKMAVSFWAYLKKWWITLMFMHTLHSATILVCHVFLKLLIHMGHWTGLFAINVPDKFNVYWRAAQPAGHCGTLVLLEQRRSSRSSMYSWCQPPPA